MGFRDYLKKKEKKKRIIMVARFRLRNEIRKGRY